MNIDIPNFPRDGHHNRKGILSHIVDDIEEAEDFDLPPDQEADDPADEDFDLDTDDLVAVDVHFRHGLI